MPSAKVNVSVPTGVRCTLAASNGVALNAGPVVRTSVPLKTPLPTRLAVADSHIGVPSLSYVNQLAKTLSPWCVKYTPQPDSAPPGVHQLPW